MGNLILTSRCTEGCSYCFADTGNPEECLTSEQIVRFLPFLRSMKHDCLRIMGGEPTLNPAFLGILTTLLDSGFEVTVFTNGKLPVELIQELKRVDRAFWLCVNRTNPALAPETALLYRKLGYRIYLSATIYEQSQAVDHIIDEIHAYRLRPEYRLSLAHPVWPGKANRYSPTSEYSSMAQAVWTLVLRGVERGYRPLFDCGFPYCFFTQQQRSYLVANGICFLSSCGPIPDIIPGGFIVPCLPLARIRFPMAAGMQWDSLRREFEGDLKRRNQIPIYKACLRCSDIRENRCSGGCLAHRLMPEPTETLLNNRVEPALGQESAGSQMRPHRTGQGSTGRTGSEVGS